MSHQHAHPPSTIDDQAAMRHAIDASNRALAAGNSPYGAALVSADGRLLHASENRQVTSGDCTAHAEMVLVRDTTAMHGAAALHGATVYASGEPCAMCSGALFWAGVRRIVFAAPNRQQATLLGGALLPLGCADVLAEASPAVQVAGPVLEAEALAVLREAARRRTEQS